MNIQRKNSTHHFRMQSEREQTLILFMGLTHHLCTMMHLITTLAVSLFSIITRARKRAG